MTAPIPERHPDRSTRTEEPMSEPAARKRLREAREQAKAERAEAVYDVRLTHRSLPDRTEHLAEELRKVLVDNGTIPSVVRLQGAAVMVGLQMLAVDLTICERRAREVEAERDRVKAELDARIAAESADAAAGSYAGRAEEAEARAEQAEAALTELGKMRLEWGVRTRDDDPDEDIEVVSTEAIAREFASTWRSEIPDANPTAMVRTRYKPGPWREADATPRTALEREADEQGVQPVRDVAELGAGDDGPSAQEFAAFDAARREGGDA